MTDQEYFNAYKNSFNMIFSHSEDLVYLKDAEFRYQAANEPMLRFLGLDSFEPANGKIAEELPISPEMSELLPKWEKQDLLLQKEGKCGVYLTILPSTDEMNAYLVYKTPVINPETNNFLGLRGLLTRLILPHIAKLLFRIHGTKGLLLTQKAPKNAFKQYNLTNMQHIVLFLCLSNYSYTEIALLISEFVQPTTPIQVNSYLEELKLIFHVRTKNQLIEKAIGLNMHSYLPRDLFKLNSINMTSDIASLVDAPAKKSSLSLS